MAGLIGEFHHTIDAKGRMSVPSKFRTVLGDEFVISKGVEECLVIYSQSEWASLQEKLATLPRFDEAAQALREYFGSGSASVEVDQHGRILIPVNLQEHARLTKDVTIVGTMDGKAEIWDSETWSARAAKIDPKAAIKALFEKGISI